MLLSLVFLIACDGKEGTTQPAFDTDLTDTEGVTDDTTVPTDDTTVSTDDTDDTEDTESTETGEVDPLADCADALVPAAAWFEGEADGALAGSIEFGQTHVIQAEEDRLAPPLLEGREALLLFTPETVLDEGADVRVGAFEGEVLLGVLTMNPGAPELLEQALTDEPLAPYSEAAWRANLPWSWVKPGVTLRIGHSDGSLSVHEHTLDELGAPHRMTVTRAKIVLFGDEDFDTSTTPASKLASDYYGTIPAAELRWVDYAPWRLDEVVVATSTGPRPVGSEGERSATTSESDRYSILKHQLALRLSVANTGRGLVLTESWEGDSSPYGFGTYVGLGWVQNDDGTYSDVHNGGAAGGWTGWSAIYAWDCDNFFIHEVGHSLTLYHFTSGSAASWGIADEYPFDGVNLETHPWGYDTLSRTIRTWYQVNSGGQVMTGSVVQGKYDPMNGGESANTESCFPQYTAYQASQAQRWQQDSPTITEVGGVPGIYRWDSGSQSYMAEDPEPGFLVPTAVDVPVVTLVGTLGRLPDSSQTYPGLYGPSGNVFALPDPTDTSLDSVYEGARWFVEVTYADKSVDRALIARGAITDTGLYLYSLNVEADREPQQVDLYFADAEWPAIDLSAATLVHSRTLEPAPEMDAPLTAGRGYAANGDLLLEAWCDPGVDCESRRAESRWQVSEGELSFDATTELCATPEDYTALTMTATGAGGEAEVTLHAQRVVSAGEGTVAVPLSDATPWYGAPDRLQSLRVWLPYDENSGLAAGDYTGSVSLSGYLDGADFSETTVEVQFTVHETTTVDLSSGAYTHTEGVYIADSSVYYTVQDGSMGPDYATWWDDGDGLPTLLRVPVVDQTTGEVVTLNLDAWKLSCGSYWDLNTGQGAGHGCTHQVVLAVAEDNPGLTSGHEYRSPGSSPLVVDGRRWHEPQSGEILATYAFEIAYTAP